MRAQHGGQLVDVGAAAAELARHAGLEQASPFQRGEVLGHVLVLVRNLPARELGPEHFGSVDNGVRLDFVSCGDTHDIFSLGGAADGALSDGRHHGCYDPYRTSPPNVLAADT